VYNAALPDPGEILDTTVERLRTAYDVDVLGAVVSAGVREDGIHAATVTIAGAVQPGTDFDPANIAELFWTAHTDSKDAWQTEYRFTGA
jgi:hypothetical protein